MTLVSKPKWFLIPIIKLNTLNCTADHDDIPTDTRLEHSQSEHTSCQAEDPLHLVFGDLR